MKGILILLLLTLVILPQWGISEELIVWQLITADGKQLTEICEEPSLGDAYITSDNQLYEITGISGRSAVASPKGQIDLPAVEWLEPDAAMPVASVTKRIALYCTHSDESYEPSDGYYSTGERGSIYQVAAALAESLRNKGIEATAADTLHHPHDAGAYRRSRQTAVQLLKTVLPDCLIDIHRDGIPDPASYAITIGGEDVSKIRLLVGRGNQNAEVNKEFALLIKAVADRIYPGLIKDIYMGKGAFNQDLYPRSILFECGTYTLEKERVLRSMPLIADVLNRALYGGVVGSAGRITSDVGEATKNTGEITMGEPDSVSRESEGIGGGFGFLGVLMLVGVVGIAILSTGSIRRGMKKAGRNVSEMTGGLIGKTQTNNEDHEHS